MASKQWLMLSAAVLVILLEAPSRAPSQQGEEPAQARLDGSGDLLPDGAVARLGSRPASGSFEDLQSLLSRVESDLGGFAPMNPFSGGINPQDWYYVK